MDFLGEVWKYIVGGGLGVLIISTLASRWLNKKLNAAEEKSRKREEEIKRREEYATREYLLLEKHRKALGSVLFWLVRGLRALQKDMQEAEPGKSYWNGELDGCLDKLKAAETEMEQLKNEQIGDLRKD